MKLVLVLLALALVPMAAVYAALGDALGTSASTFEATAIEHPMRATTSQFWGPNYKRPYPTNTWWINLVLGGNNPIKTFPYLMRVNNNKGFGLCYPGRTSTKGYIVETMLENLSVGSRETVGSRQVMSHDDLSVTVQFTSDANSRMVSPIVRGQAYHTVEYTNLSPQLSTIHAITGVNGGGNPGTVSGTKLKLALNNGQTWIIYSSSSITWTISGTNIQANSRFTGTLRVAYIMNPASHESIFDQYSGAYPSGGKVTYSIQSAQPKDLATLRFRFTKKGSGNLMMFTLPHHRDVLQNPSYVTPQVRYRSIKGYCDAIIGDEWVLQEKLVNDIGFYGRYTISDKDVGTLRAALQGDQNSYPSPKDPYFGGKAVARLGRLALVADELKETALAQKIRGNMKTYFNKWLGGEGYTASDNKLVYEKSFGGLVSKNSVGSSGADFGQYYYNDHHFHYGYFVYAAAVIIKKDQAWGTANRQKLYEIVRDFGNPSTSDPSFTTLRSKDWFVGHSFAAGLFAFADSRNQESTSESVNAYYGMYLLGLVFRDQNMADLGRILLETEIRSSQKYWQITQDSDIYDDVFKQNKCVGIVWETKVDYATFFGANVEFIHGIQMLPYTPIAEDLIRPQWIKESYEVFKSAYGSGASQGWLGLLYSAQATFDLNGAWNRIMSLTGFDDGNTKTNTLYWLFTRPSANNKKRTDVFADIDGSNLPPVEPPTPEPPTPEPPTPEPPTPEPPTQPPAGQCTTDANCGTGMGCCNRACYDASKYDCVYDCAGKLVSKTPQPPTEPSIPAPQPPTQPPTPPPGCPNVCKDMVIGNVCYDPARYICANNNRLCPIGTGACGTACYDVRNYKCCPGNRLAQINQNC